MQKRNGILNDNLMIFYTFAYFASDLKKG